MTCRPLPRIARAVAVAVAVVVATAQPASAIQVGPSECTVVAVDLNPAPSVELHPRIERCTLF